MGLTNTTVYRLRQYHAMRTPARVYYNSVWKRECKNHLGMHIKTKRSLYFHAEWYNTADTARRSLEMVWTLDGWEEEREERYAKLMKTSPALLRPVGPELIHTTLFGNVRPWAY